jgi:UPF0716 family protein affecting phage T7 exclusion
MTLRRITPALLVAGLVLMIPFETLITRVLGVACLIAFVACGLFLIASPEYLAREEDASPPPG